MTPELQQEIAAAVEQIVHGWSSFEKGCALAEAIIETQPKVIVEIGVYAAKSLVPQALACRAIGHGRVYGIDPWRREHCLEGGTGKENDEWWGRLELSDIHRYAVDQIWNRGLQEWTILIQCPSQTCVELFPRIGMLHIDGNHSEVASCRDVDLYLPRVKKDGYVFFDDADWLSTQKALGLIAEQCDLIKQVGTCNLYKKR